MTKGWMEGDDATNAYYVWPRVTTEEGGSYTVQADPQREYLTSFISRRAREWIVDRTTSRTPWLAFVTHSASHTPIQTPPPSLSTPGPGVPDCTLDSVAGDYRVQYKRVAEVEASRELPQDRPYNSFVTLADGRLVTKDFVPEAPEYKNVGYRPVFTARSPLSAAI